MGGIAKMKTVRVFPRRTNATPTDEDAYIGHPTLFAKADRVLVDCTFTWDLPEAERLAEAWKWVAPVEIGGVAFGNRGGEFEPGLFIKPGYVITSRGCPNRCWFCSVWKREGSEIRELEIKDGYNVLDDNLLACSDQHIRAVFEMLKRQKERAQFTGGLESKRLKEWHVEELVKLKPKQVFFAYDTPDDLEPLIEAGKILHGAGFTNRDHSLRAYVLIGYTTDTFEKAEIRLKQTVAAGFIPMAMLYRDNKGGYSNDWRRFSRVWARPAAMSAAGLI
jgi:hypothetical protein